MILVIIFLVVFSNVQKLVDLECNEFFVKTAVYSGLWKTLPETRIVYGEENTYITRESVRMLKPSVSELNGVVIHSFSYTKGQTLKNGVKIEPIVFRIR